MLWGTGIYLGMQKGGGTLYRGLLQGGYSGVIGVLWGYCRYCRVLWVTMGYCRYCRYWVVLGVLGGAGDQKRLLWGTA